jgi:hypothetical protein
MKIKDLLLRIELFNTSVQVVRSTTYEYALCYVDAISSNFKDDPRKVQVKVWATYGFYLGAQLSKMTNANGTQCGHNLRTNTLRNRSKPFRNS